MATFTERAALSYHRRNLDMAFDTDLETLARLGSSCMRVAFFGLRTEAAVSEVSTFR